MSRFKNQLIGAGILALLGVTGTIMNAQHNGRGSEPVTVVNTNANPVPVTGSTVVSGTVAATQSGTWNVGIHGTPSVNIANPSSPGSSAVQVRDVNHGLQPFTFDANLFIEDGTRGTLVGPFSQAVPAGKRLVGEYLGGFCAGQAGQAYSIAVLNRPPLGIFPDDQTVVVFAETSLSPVSLSGPYPFTSVGQRVSFYIDAGESFSLGAFRSSTTGLVTCNSRLTGHLIDVP